MPATGKRNDQRTDMLSADFQKRYEPNFAWKSVAAQHQSLLGLRGYWPMSSFDENGDAFDLSEQNRTLSYTGNPLYAIDGLAPYIALDGTGDWLLRADEAGLDILGTETYINATYRGLMMGCWARFDNAAGTAESIMSKWNPATNNRSYSLHRLATGIIRARVSVDGTAVINSDSATAPAANTWFSAIMVYDPSAELSIWINGVEASNAVAIPANIFNGNSDFRIGSLGDNSAPMTGRVSNAFLCAARSDDPVVKSIFWQSQAMFGV